MSGALSATTLAAVNAGLISVATASALPAAGTVLAGASLAGTAISGLGALQQSKAASASAGYNAEVAANNAKIATQNSQFAGAEGEQNVAASAAKTRAAVGATIANQGASGIDVNSGSALDTRESEAKLGMLNTLNIRSQAARQAYGYSTEATAFTGQQALQKLQQSSDQTGGYLNAGSTVLGGIGKASQYTNWLNQGSL